MAHAGQTALALALVLAAGCGDDGSGTEGDSEDVTGTPMTSTNPTTGPTTGASGSETTDGEESGSEGSSSDSGAVEVDYMADIQPIWDMRCVAGCHIESGIAQTNGPILTAAVSYGELIDVMSKTVPGIVQVKPGSTAESYLWHKVKGTQANVGGLGLQMPQGGMLSDDDLAKIEAWITAGAKPSP